MYDYDYEDPGTYFSLAGEEEPGNVSLPKAVDKYVSVWQHDDASWIFSAVFMVLSMQTGFALLESGCGSLKNEANIMMKNAIDVVMGGFSYWILGYGLRQGGSQSRNSILFLH